MCRFVVLVTNYRSKILVYVPLKVLMCGFLMCYFQIVFADLTEQGINYKQDRSTRDTDRRWDD